MYPTHLHRSSPHCRFVSRAFFWRFHSLLAGIGSSWKTLGTVSIDIHEVQVGEARLQSGFFSYYRSNEHASLSSATPFSSTEVESLQKIATFVFKYRPAGASQPMTDGTAHLISCLDVLQFHNIIPSLVIPLPEPVLGDKRRISLLEDSPTSDEDSDGDRVESADAMDVSFRLEFSLPDSGLSPIGTAQTSSPDWLTVLSRTAVKADETVNMNSPTVLIKNSTHPVSCIIDVSLTHFSQTDSHHLFESRTCADVQSLARSLPLFCVLVILFGNLYATCPSYVLLFFSCFIYNSSSRPTHPIDRPTRPVTLVVSLHPPPSVWISTIFFALLKSYV